MHFSVPRGERAVRPLLERRKQLQNRNITKNPNGVRTARRGGRVRFAAALGALTLLGAAGVVALDITAPRPAQARLDLVSEKQELEAGREAAKQVAAKYKFEKGTSRAQLVEILGRRMSKASGRTNIPWSFNVIEDKTVNAFSIPGYVYVNTGLLDAVGNDKDALAGVVAHEVGHIAAKHSKKQMEKSAVTGLLGGLLSRGNRTTGSILNLAGGLTLLKFSRDDEYQADSLAVKYLEKTGYDPEGMVRFFRKLEAQEGKTDKVSGFFQTHPNSGDRIERIQKRIGDTRG